MALAPGTRLGPYEVTAAIGEGGMGEVYRATDTNLNRQVAIKVLPEAVAADPERLARFDREAKTLAALNHPNIAQIYGLERADGVTALVMELVEGPTLAEVIGSGVGRAAWGVGHGDASEGRKPHAPRPTPQAGHPKGLSLSDALPIAKQITDALEAAHEQGIIHRDLKPANIKVKDDGTVKVLDFGLAKAIGPEGVGPATDLSMSPTITTPAMTQAGLILGTAAYMSPEQARGRPVDKRADVWAFGVVFYEMLTGRRLFDGEDMTDTLARVVRDTPDLSAAPAGMRRLLGRCLEKDPKRRLRDIGDVWELIEEPGPEAAATPMVSRLPWMLAAAIAGGLATGLFFWTVRAPEPAPLATVRAEVLLPVGQRRTESAGQSLAISPDGTQLIYSADGQLWLRLLDRWDPTRLSGTGDGLADAPFFSPDGQWVAFHSGGELRKLPVTGGAAAAPLASATATLGGSWGEDDRILYSQGSRGIWRIPASGGTPEQVITVGEGEVAYGAQALPGGDRVLFTLRPAGVASWNDAQIVAQSIETGARTVLIEGGHDAQYVPTGHLLYARNGVLMGVPFEPDSRAVGGVPTAFVDGVYEMGTVTPVSFYTVTAGGTVVYMPASSQASRLVWLNRAGMEIEEVGQTTGEARDFVLSPDEQRVAYWEVDQHGDVDIWVLNLSRGDRTRITNTPGIDVRPTWSQDGEWLAFTNQFEGVVLTRADGSGDQTQLVGAVMDDWSSDGRFIMYDRPGEGTGRDVWYLERSADGSRWEPHEYLATPANELVPKFSPDGRYVVYVSDESGEREVYVRPFPEGGRRWTVSVSGGQQPRWSRDGRELFYLEGGARLMALNVSTSGEFTAGTPHLLFEYPQLGAGLEYPRYDVSGDGQRFLTVEPVAGSDRLTLRIVQNAFGELREGGE